MSQDHSNKVLTAAALPAIILELHLQSMQALEGIDGRRSLCAQVRDATTTLNVAFERATGGVRPQYQLARLRGALVDCRAGFRLLCAEGRLPNQTFEEIRRRVHQLLQAIEALKDSPVEDWASVAIPALEPAIYEVTKNPALMAIHVVQARVAATARLARKIRTGKPPGEPDQGAAAA